MSSAGIVHSFSISTCLFSVKVLVCCEWRTVTSAEFLGEVDLRREHCSTPQGECLSRQVSLWQRWSWHCCCLIGMCLHSSEAHAVNWKCDCRLPLLWLILWATSWCCYCSDKYNGVKLLGEYEELKWSPTVRGGGPPVWGDMLRVGGCFSSGDMDESSSPRRLGLWHHSSLIKGGKQFLTDVLHCWLRGGGRGGRGRVRVRTLTTSNYTSHHWEEAQWEWRCLVLLGVCVSEWQTMEVIFVIDQI